VVVAFIASEAKAKRVNKAGNGQLEKRHGKKGEYGLRLHLASQRDASQKPVLPPAAHDLDVHRSRHEPQKCLTVSLDDQGFGRGGLAILKQRGDVNTHVAFRLQPIGVHPPWATGRRLAQTSRLEGVIVRFDLRVRAKRHVVVAPTYQLERALQPRGQNLLELGFRCAFTRVLGSFDSWSATFGRVRRSEFTAKDPKVSVLTA
jgi:hypothetical protein